MKIGVISDTHDNLSNLIFALDYFRQGEIDTIVHCGDLTRLEMISHLSGFRVIYLTGNMDIATGSIKSRLDRMREDNYVGTVFQGKLGGVLVAATHGHISNKIMDLISQKKFKWIFHGHTHEKRDEMIRGTRVVNPGALGGMGREQRSFCVVDLESDEVEFIRVN